MLGERLHNFIVSKTHILMKAKYLQVIRTLLAAMLFIPVPILIARNNAVNPTIVHRATSTNPLCAEDLFNAMQLGQAGLSKDAFLKAWQGYNNIAAQHISVKAGIITIVDFSKPSSKERLFVVDLNHKKILHSSLVAHGRNSGLVYAKSFSNQPETYKSSLGFYKTLHTYEGENGFSLRLEGLEKNINDKAFQRAIVMHGADYVSKKLARERGFIGRSYGCPAIPHDKAPQIIRTIKDGSLLFIYYPDKKYDKVSKLI
jgi:hypothetical protein